MLYRAGELAQTVKWLEDDIQELKVESKAVEVQHNLAQAEAEDKLKALTDENSLLKNRCIAFVVSWFCCCTMPMRADCVTWYYAAHTQHFPDYCLRLGHAFCCTLPQHTMCLQHEDMAFLHQLPD